MLENAYALSRTQSTYLQPCAVGSLRTVCVRKKTPAAVLEGSRNVEIQQSRM